jgi:phosphotransacetylase
VQHGSVWPGRCFDLGLNQKLCNHRKPALQIIGTEEGVNRVAGMYMMITPKGPVFFGDTTVNVNPTVQELVDITVLIERSVNALISARGLLYYRIPTSDQMRV